MIDEGSNSSTMEEFYKLSPARVKIGYCLLISPQGFVSSLPFRLHFSYTLGCTINLSYVLLEEPKNVDNLSYLLLQLNHHILTGITRIEYTISCSYLFRKAYRITR